MTREIRSLITPGAELYAERWAEMVTISVFSPVSNCWCKVSVTRAEAAEFGTLLAALAGIESAEVST